MSNETIGQRIRRLRKEHGLTIHELELKIRVTHDILGKWERDENGGQFFNAIELAKALNVSLDYIAGLSQDRTPR